VVLLILSEIHFKFSPVLIARSFLFLRRLVNMDSRISLDSDMWSSLVAGEDVRSMLQKLSETDHPVPEDIAEIVSRVDGGEYMEQAFYFLIPYLLDYFEKYPFKLRTAMVDFSRGIINVLYKIPPDENEVHILGSRNRIVDVLCTALKFGGSTDDFQVYLGAIAALYRKPELGREVMLLDFEP